MSKSLSLQAHNLYAQLLDAAMHSELARLGLLSADGCVIRKTVRGREYLYYQYRENGKQKQSYVGPASDAHDRFLSEWQQERSSAQKLSAMFIRGGGYQLDSFASGLLDSFATHGLFAGGGVLVGTYAFLAYQNMLGVRWSEALMTTDVDIARDRHHVDLAILPGHQIAVQEIMGTLRPEMKPIFDVMRGTRQIVAYAGTDGQSRLDLLTPMVGKESVDPVYVPALKSFAEPLRFLDYLIEDAQYAVAINRHMQPILIMVPNPARFALHKLLISQKRPKGQEAKSIKDILQADQLLGFLIERSSRSYDIVEAWEGLHQRGKKWVTPVCAGMARCSDTVRVWMDAHGISSKA
ncbi:GSU2403 family nucleotidyltransferase fold protein [Acidithiobacillus ferridurans]|uniref:Uncharacterized protein n=1 Tax=Acidithiobacillus ferridurans TaxID=1232575 RepID=A0A8X8KEI7_ACIFI|nr:GSU2403 family nucleotidyltransferase fold protein [Acidithiobacillus ferridurans]MBU2714584.1 hypothetical protein [Acidithiobacillus ferridurans]MBU2724794.1 hypothetical protein [Acidithiobacillus ferridurans]MBU2725852.1 hypothetical protein [Acidithiobacillus ferridurans]